MEIVELNLKEVTPLLSSKEKATQKMPLNTFKTKKLEEEKSILNGVSNLEDMIQAKAKRKEILYLQEEEGMINQMVDAIFATLKVILQENAEIEDLDIENIANQEAKANQEVDLVIDTEENIDPEVDLEIETERDIEVDLKINQKVKSNSI